MSELELKQTADEAFLPGDFELAGEKNDVATDKSYANISAAKDSLKRLVKNKGALFSIALILIVVIMALAGPGMNEYTYQEMDTKLASLPPRIPVVENLGIFDGTENGVDMYEKAGAADKYFWFGTDTLGRDLWTRLWEGTRVSLTIAFVAAAGGLIIGVIYGMVSGYLGGKTDMVMQRIIEVINGIPSLVIMTLMVMVLNPSVGAIILALLLTGWIGMARMVRGQTMKAKESEFILASKTLGASTGRILVKGVLPNIFSQVIIMCMFSIPSAIFAESFLAFVGLGLPQPQPSLGILISEGYKTMTIHPFQMAIPVIVLAILMLSFNIFADGLRDALDPKMKER